MNTASLSVRPVMTKYHLLSLFCFCFQLPADAAALALLQNDDVYGDTSLFLLCFLGSSMGAYCAVWLFPPSAPKEIESSVNLRSMIRRLCAKFGFSMFSGMTVSPMLMDYCEIEGRNYVVGISAVVSFNVVMGVHFASKLMDFRSRRIVNIHVQGPVNQVGGKIDNERD